MDDSYTSSNHNRNVDDHHHVAGFNNNNNNNNNNNVINPINSNTTNFSTTTTIPTSRYPRMIIDVDDYSDEEDEIEDPYDNDRTLEQGEVEVGGRGDDSNFQLDDTVIASNVSSSSSPSNTIGTCCQQDNNESITHGESVVPDVQASCSIDVVAPPQLQRHQAVSSATVLPRRIIFDVDEDLEEGYASYQHQRRGEPSLTSNPICSKSQEMALKAVLGNEEDLYDDVDKSIADEKKISGQQSTSTLKTEDGSTTKELDDDEVGAIIPPPLQRNTRNNGINSSPGAFPVTPTSTSLSPSRRIVTTANSNRRNFPVFNNDHHHLNDTSGMNIISATLVVEDDVDALTSYCSGPNNTTYVSEMSHTANDHDNSPILVHAERLWWKRRLVLCISVWMLCAIAVMSISIVLALQYSKVTSKESTTSNSTPVVVPASSPHTSSTNEATASKASTPSTPTPSINAPSTNVPSASDSLMSMHAVSFGIVTTCDDILLNETDLSSFQIELSCGGTIQPFVPNNIVCSSPTIGLGGSKVHCQFTNETQSFFIASTIPPYQHVTGQVLFACQGSVARDVMPVAEMNDGSIQDCSRNETAKTTTYISLGSFCADDVTQYSVRNFISECENGERWDSLTAIDDDYLLDSIGGAVLNVINGDLPVDVALELFDSYKSFCYGTKYCMNTPLPLLNEIQEQCAINDMPRVTVSSKLLFEDLCPNPYVSNNEIDNNLDIMWNLTLAALDPSTYIEIIVGDN